MKVSLTTNQTYTRSVNLERDFRSPEIALASVMSGCYSNRFN